METLSTTDLPWILDQDPRLEAAKPKGRGTADASEKALEVGTNPEPIGDGKMMGMIGTSCDTFDMIVNYLSQLYAYIRVCVYIYIHTYVRTYVRPYIYIHIHIHTYT